MKFCAWVILVLYAIRLVALPTVLIGKPIDWTWRDMWIAIAFAPVFIFPCGRILGWW